MANARHARFGRFVLPGLVLASACAAAVTLGAQQNPITRALTEPWRPVVKVQGIEILPVRKNVWALMGGGGNITAQVGEEGVMLVDAGAAGQTDAILAAIRSFTPKPIRILVNTSSDADHAGGNGAIVAAAGGLAGPAGGGAAGGRGNAVPRPQNEGIRTIAHENAAMRMMGFLKGDAIPDSTFFTPRKDLFANGEGVVLLTQNAAHTDGDLFVHFRGSDVVSTGDIYRPDGFPRLDKAAGGTLAGEIEALTTLLEITIPERNQMGGTMVVPGHGRLSNEADVVEYRDMIAIIRDRVEAMVKKGATLQQVQAAKLAKEYDPFYGKDPRWTTDMFIEAVYREVGGK